MLPLREIHQLRFYKYLSLRITVSKKKSNLLQVADSLDRTLDHFGFTNLAELAKELRVSTQAVHAWAIEERVPPKRALQIECLTEGAIGWEEFLPGFREEVLRDAVLCRVKKGSASLH